jgi:hypothetical protein
MFSFTGWERSERAMRSDPFALLNQRLPGFDPAAGLIGDTLGNIYGTTYMGGNGYEGTVFELSPNAGKTAGTETVLYRFLRAGQLHRWRLA